jgi:hypothetical protein
LNYLATTKKTEGVYVIDAGGEKGGRQWPPVLVDVRGRALVLAEN